MSRKPKKIQDFKKKVVWQNSVGTKEQKWQALKSHAYL
jgi:hypothetical protein